MSDKINATDSAIKLADSRGIDIADVTGTGANGRVLKKDVALFYDPKYNVDLDELYGHAQAPAPSSPVWVKLVGADRAILDGSYILRNEARRVSFHTYEQARNARPGDFAVKYDGSTAYIVETVETAVAFSGLDEEE